METFAFKKEQLGLASRIVLKDNFNKINSIGGTACVAIKDKLLACVVVCDLPSLKLKEYKIFILANPLPYHPNFVAYREMPALIEAYNKLEQEPDVLLVNGFGILHPRRIGIASHLGLALNKATIGIADHLLQGKVEHGKIFMQADLCGFEIKTKEFARPIYVSPGHFVSLGAALNIATQTIIYPHKMPEPLHLAHKIAKKKAAEMFNQTLPPPAVK